MSMKDEVLRRMRQSHRVTAARVTGGAGREGDHERGAGFQLCSLRGWKSQS